MKKIWITSLLTDDATIRQVMATLKGYGLGAQGHHWLDDLDQLAWSQARGEITAADTALWAVLATAEDLQSPSLRYGLSLLALSVQALKGHNFPIVILLAGPQTPPALPGPLRAAEVLDVNTTTLGAKLVAKTHTPVIQIDPGYRIDCYGSAQIGQWFEIGPSSAWNGAMFAVSGAEIDFHATGPKGQLPERATLEYPLQNLRFTLGQREFSAWAVRNEIDDQSSYFARVQGHPAAIAFGSYPHNDDPEVFTIELK